MKHNSFEEIPHQKFMAAYEKSPALKSEKTEAEINARIAERIDYELLKKKLKTGETIFSREAVDALAHLVIKLEDKIDQYDTILSDDISGRPVSLILMKIINRRKDEFKGEPVVVYGLGSGRHGSLSNFLAIEEFISGKKEALGKTLLVTEFITSGRSIEKMINILERQGIDFDAAAVSVANPIESYNKDLRKHLYFGREASDAGRDFYGIKKWVGLTKEEGSAHPIRDVEALQVNINKVREDADAVAQELYQLLS